MELKKGYKQTDIGIIPAEWKLMTIDQIFEFHSTSNYSKAEMLSEGEIGCFHYGLIHSLPNNNYDIRNGVKYFVTKQQAKYEFIKDGDLVMVDASEDLSGVNKSIEISGIDDKLYISGLHTFLLRDRGFFEKYFKGQILNSYFTKAQFYRLAVGMKVFGVSKQNIKTVLLPVPTKSEQIAIANALSDIDSNITSLENLIEKKKAIKQGAMQKLLKPKYGWVSYKLEEICVIKKGQQLNKSTLTQDGDFPVMNGGVSPSGFTSQYNQNADTIIISEGGNSCGFVNFITTKFWQGGHCYSIETRQNTDFLYHIMKFKEKEIMSLRVGSGLPNIQLKRLYSFQLIIPEMEFQIELAEIFNSFDLEIKALNIKLNKLKELKQSMMQNLLTGKIRII